MLTLDFGDNRFRSFDVS